MTDWYWAELYRTDDHTPSILHNPVGPKGEPIAWSEIFRAIDERAKQWSMTGVTGG